MYIRPVQTNLVQPGDDLFAFLENNLGDLQERSVIVIASKIIATCQNRVVPVDVSNPAQKHQLVEEEADLFLPPHSSKYNLMLTVKNSILAVNAGIDRSNIADGFLLWPDKPQQVAAEIWHFLKEKYQLKQLGVIISDSRSFMLQWGVIGQAIGFCGFRPLRDYRGNNDLFGYEMKMEQTSVVHSLCTAAVLEMGEGAEQQPLAIISDIQQIDFMDHPPDEALLDSLHIELEDDVYHPLLEKVEWQQGGGGKQ